MWKPYIPFYIPCRQATSDETSALHEYLLRDVAAQASKAATGGYADKNEDNSVMDYEIASHEVFSLTHESIIVIFDWRYYQTSSLAPLHDSTQEFAKVMCVFWKGNPDAADLFTWECDGRFHRLVSNYSPEERLRAGNWHTQECLL